jgi:hypothetical protein
VQVIAGSLVRNWLLIAWNGRVIVRMPAHLIGPDLLARRPAEAGQAGALSAMAMSSQVMSGSGAPASPPPAITSFMPSLPRPEPDRLFRDDCHRPIPAGTSED